MKVSSRLSSSSSSSSSSASTSRVSLTFPSPAEYVSTCPIFHVLPEQVPSDVSMFPELELDDLYVREDEIVLDLSELEVEVLRFPPLFSSPRPHPCSLR